MIYDMMIMMIITISLYLLLKKLVSLGDGNNHITGPAIVATRNQLKNKRHLVPFTDASTCVYI
jgi:hypothetical protein